MKNLLITGMFLLMGLASNTAIGSCSSEGYTNSLNSAQIQNALNGKRILATAPDGEEWHEDHCSSSALYKVGDGSTVDPRAFRGTWVASGAPTGMVSYNYTVGGNSQFTWTLWKNTPGNQAGGLCWEDSGTVIATAPAPGAAEGPCDIPQ